jgi:hypothetical protein
MKKVAQNLRYFFLYFQNTAQSKQSINRRNTPNLVTLTLAVYVRKVP